MNINDCASAECGKGTCIDGISSHLCNCSGTGYDGTKCENDINECDSTPCDHNATCSNYGGGYTCKCNVGYSGKNCENNIDDCALRPCKNGGISVMVVMKALLHYILILHFIIVILTRVVATPGSIKQDHTAHISCIWH